MEEFLDFSKLSNNAFEPTKGSPNAVGYDLSSAYEYNIMPGQICKCLTDIQIKPPPNCYPRISGRSGLAYKHLIHVMAGTIDPDYRGNIGVLLYNFGCKTYHVRKGDRIAQMTIEKFQPTKLRELFKLEEHTERGTNGFGSTGY